MGIRWVGCWSAVCCAGPVIAPAAAQTQLWIRQVGTSGTDHFLALAPDGAGGAFVSGRTSGSLFGPPPPAGNYMWLLARYDAAGGLTWGRQLGITIQGLAAALAPDGSGGVYAAGAYFGGLFPTWVAGVDAVLARYDSSGNLIWGRQFGSSGPDQAYCTTSVAGGVVFVGGSTGGEAFGSYAGGAEDVWFACFDDVGNLRWGRQIGTSGVDRATGLAPDGSGGVYVGGSADPGLGTPGAGSRDAFLARYDSMGNQVWIRQYGSTEFDWATALASDNAGGVYQGGRTRGSLAGPNAGDFDAWVARYDSAGTQGWVRQFGSSAFDVVASLAARGDGGVLLAGSTAGSLFGTIGGSGDAWIARYDGAGNRIWDLQFGTETRDDATAAAPDATGGFFLVGTTEGSLGAPGAGSFDAFLARQVDACYPDCDTSGTLNVNDYICFQTKFALGDPYADCDGSGVRNVNDYICFQTKFALGCS